MYSVSKQDIFILLLLAFALSFLCGFFCFIIAEKKGRGGAGWFVLGFLTNCIGLLFLLTASDLKDVFDKRGVEEGTCKKCAYCAEVVRAEATRCHYCHKDFPDESSEESNVNV